MRQRLQCAVCSFVGLRGFFSGLDPKKAKQLLQSGITLNKPRGRELPSLMFEKKIVLRSMESIDDMCHDWTENICVVDSVELDDLQAPISHPSKFPLYSQLKIDEYPLGVRRNLRENSHTWCTTFEGQFNVITVVNPNMRHRKFHREETQIELITAYRNILFDFFDLKRANVLRVPVLSLGRVLPQYEDEVPKLTQQSIIKGFHRVPDHVKEWFIMLKNFSLELYVPQPMLQTFEETFKEEPWEAPSGIFMPHRLNMYPGLPVPPALLQESGWVGNRQEIVDSVKTEGRSLEEMARLPDGSEAVPYDAVSGAITSSMKSGPRPRK